MKQKSIKLTLVMLLICTAASVQASETGKNPKAEKIMNGYIAAIGGKAALENIQNLVSHSELKFIESGLTIDRKIVETRSGRYYIQVSSPQTGEITRGCDDRNCWEQRQESVRVIDGEERKSFLNSSSALRFADWENHLKDYSYEGLVTKDGIKMHKIIVTTRYGMSETWYFNKKTNYLVRIEEPLPLPDGMTTITTTFENFREVNGVKLPFTHTVIMPGQTRQISFSSISSNQDIKETLFALPESK